MMKKRMGLGIALLFAASPAYAADSSAKEIEELRQELKAMQREVYSLRRAIFDIAESDRRRAYRLARALNALSDRSESGGRNGGRRNPKRRQADKDKEKQETAAPGLDEAEEESAPAVGRIVGRVSVPSGEPVAYVYVQDVKGRAVRGKKVKIDQRGKKFVPDWAVIRRGTTVEFPNLDNIYHNVFSRTEGNSFDLGLYRRGDESKEHRFFEPGPVDVYCNIHPRMNARILVVPNQYFAKVREDGRFILSDVPVGNRVIAAWSPGAKLETARVRIETGGTAEVNLSLERRASAHLNKHGMPYGSYP